MTKNERILRDAIKLAISDIQGYLNGDWNGCQDGWEDIVSMLKNALGGKGAE